MKWRWRGIPVGLGCSVHQIVLYSRWVGQVSHWVRGRRVRWLSLCQSAKSFLLIFYFLQHRSEHTKHTQTRTDEKLSEGEIAQHATNNIYETSLNPAYPPIPPIPSTQLPYLLSCSPLLTLRGLKWLWTALLTWLLKSHAHEEGSRRFQGFRSA